MSQLCTKSNNSTSNSNESTYIVQNGDTLAGISLRFNIRVSELKLLNHLLGGSSIFVGQVLRICQFPSRNRSKSLPGCFAPEIIANINENNQRHHDSNYNNRLKISVINECEEITDDLSNNKQSLDNGPELNDITIENKYDKDKNISYIQNNQNDISSNKDFVPYNVTNDIRNKKRSLSLGDTSVLSSFSQIPISFPSLIGGSSTEILVDEYYQKRLLPKLESSLPRHSRGYDWKLLYSLPQHGASLSTLYRYVRDQHPTLLIIKSEKNQVFGGFTSVAWKPQGEKYYGNGECFLFTCYKTFEIFPWTGSNTFFMLCSDEYFAMGGGSGSFGLFVNSDMSHGSSGTCETFNNRCLAGEEHFEIVSLEIWGFCTKT